MKTDNAPPLKPFQEPEAAQPLRAGLSLLDRTFASSYPTADEIDPDEEAFALGKAVQILLRVKEKDGNEGKLGGRMLIDHIKEEGSILSLKDVARVLHRAWRNNLIHRAIDRPHLRDTRHSFVYWVDETNAALEEVLATLAIERSAKQNEHSKEPTAMMPAPVNLLPAEVAPFASTFVEWLSLDGRKTPMQGVTVADIPAGTSAYAHLERVSRKAYARNFKDVAGVDRVLVFDERSGRYYAPAVHVIAKSAEASKPAEVVKLAEETQGVEPIESKKAGGELEDRVTDAAPSALALPPEVIELQIPAGEAEAVETLAPLALEETFLRSYETAVAWRTKTGLAWSANFMADLIGQAAREVRQVAREREHHRAVRRVVLAQTDLLRAAILLDEGAESPLGEGYGSPLGEGAA